MARWIVGHLSNARANSRRPAGDTLADDSRSASRALSYRLPAPSVETDRSAGGKMPL